MDKELKADRASTLVALADSMKKFGPVYRRLPSDVQNRERKLSHSLLRNSVDSAEGFTHSTFDMNRSFGL